MKGYESLTEYDPMDTLIFEEPHVTGGIARIHIQIWQVLQFMDTVYANRGKLEDKPSDDILVGDFIANHGAYLKVERSKPQQTWMEAMKEYWSVKD